MNQKEQSESSSGINEQSSLGLVETKYFSFADPPNKFILENGKELGPITIAYETYGELNKTRNNVILIEHALTASAHVAGINSPDDKDPGWWDVIIGPGKVIDTDKYFLDSSCICNSYNVHFTILTGATNDLCCRNRDILIGVILNWNQDAQLLLMLYLV